MGSSRLPGKVLLKINGCALLEHQINRLRKSLKINKIVIATSILDKDQPIVELAEQVGIECYRGSETDVLGRFYEASLNADASTIVRLTADNPLVDPEIVDKTIELFETHGADYAANTVPPESSSFPDGSDVEVFSSKALLRAHTEATSSCDREHVTFYFWKYSNGFKTVQLKSQKDWSMYRITVDYPEDVKVIEFLINTLEGKNLNGSLHEVVNELESNPEITRINSKHEFGKGWNINKIKQLM